VSAYIVSKNRSVNNKDIRIYLSDFDTEGNRGNIAVLTFSKRARVALEQKAYAKKITVDALFEQFLIAQLTQFMSRKSPS
jgi:hypothetical protein